MRTCRNLAELLLELIDDSLSPQQRESVERHFRQCPSCVAYVESYRVTVRLAKQLPRTPLSPRLTRRLQGLLRKGEAGAPEELGG
jgi:anti-sigma factor RsiW